VKDRETGAGGGATQANGVRLEVLTLDMRVHMKQALSMERTAGLQHPQVGTGHRAEVERGIETCSEASRAC
jgi:hypothetical protein